MLLLFPPEVPFAPFDIAAAPGGGVLVLDRAHRVYWALDRQFQIVSGPPAPTAADPGGGEPLPFHPLGALAEVLPPAPVPSGFPLAAEDPISIEALADGSVLILDSPALAPLTGTPSTLYHYRLGTQVAPPLPLEADVDVATAGTDVTSNHLALVGHDIAYSADDQTLYVADRDAKQTIALGLDVQAAQPALSVKRDYLPMHFYGSRALVAHQRQVYYDVVGGDPTNDAAVRWMSLQIIDQPRYERAAVLLTPIFDSNQRDCVWDRLLLDACLPPETAVTIWSRATNEQQLLEDAPFLPEPLLYRRGAGAEIPFFDPFADLTSRPAAAGTWELLFQQASGRYLQLRLALCGNGRATPWVRALRAYYPRFSYPRHYLPAVYLEDASSASFLERMLANPQGFFTDIEGKMRDLGVLLDPLTAPPETLDWLAGWVGLLLDPLWANIQARRQAAGQLASVGQVAGQTTSAPAPDRRRLFIRFALRLYNRRGTPDGIRFALHLLLDPCLETTLQRFKSAAVQPDSALRDELARYGLPYPMAVMSTEQFEDLLHDYLLAPERPSKIRLVERFTARDGRAAAAGDPTAGGATETIQAAAHRFSVLIPENLSADESAMVDRVVALEKPAHTMYDVRRYWDYFRVGEARVALDTVLGEDSRFVPMILGRDYLAEGFLYPAPPMNARDRLIVDRDPLGTRPL
jgi:phage tail-like protein